MKFQTRSNQVGSFTLTTLFSTAAGVLFVMLFYNLSGYVGSRGAITEAARISSRCITPTDPACVTVQADASNNIDFDWYARIPSQSTTADVSVRTFKYEASMPSDVWNSSFNYYRTNVGDQNFSVDYSLVPVKKFSAISASQIPSGTINATYSIQGSSVFSPKHNPNFPNFEQDRNMAANDWLNSQAPYEFIVKESGEVSINADDDYAYTTEDIKIPEIPAENGASCTGNCNVNALAGGNNSNWKDYAYVAIKAVSQIRSERNQTNLRWGKSNAFAGLEVEIKDRNGHTIPWNPDGTNLSLNWRCLGGAEQSDNVGTSWRGYNLWLRGSAGSYGGPSSSAMCPGGAYQHNSILVPRGGSFRIRAHLANTGNNRARAKITLLSYYDEYINATTAKKLVQCAPINYNGYNQEVAACALESCNPINCKSSYCPNQSLKSLSDAGIIKASLTACDIRRQNISFTCAEDEKTIPNSAKVLETVQLAVCSNTWQPTMVNNRNINSETICSWQSSEVNSWKEVGASNCQTAQNANFEGTCENPYTDTKDAKASNCKNLIDKLDQISISTSELNQTQIYGAPKFVDKTNYNFTNLKNIRTANFWTNKNAQGADLPEDKEKISENSSSIRTFVDNNGSSSTPKPNDFLEKIKSSGINAFGWEDFANHANSLIRVKKLGREDYKLSQVYPFNEEATEEIYYGQEDTLAGWDFEADCQIDKNCKCKDCQTFGTLEQMLRSHAANEVAEANNSNYALSVKATHVGYKQIGKYLPGNLPEMPECFPTRAVCSQQHYADDKLVFLGRTKERPEECKNYQECISKIPEGVELNIKDPETKIDLDLARQVGFNEIKKIVPFATLSNDCGDTPACAQIDIDTSSKTTAKVQVRYNVPIGFPLSSILQRDSFQIIHEKQEVIERDFAGSNFYN